ATAPASTTSDFSINVLPASRNLVPGASAQYQITIVPLAGFTGDVNLSASSLPVGVTASFNPVQVNIADASSKSSTVTLTTSAAPPMGNQIINMSGQAGNTSHAEQVTLNVVDPTSTDLSVTKTASPNPGQAGVNLSYRITTTNNGPAVATNVTVHD